MMHAFIAELRRRKVTRVAVVYAAAAFVVLQAADLVLPALLLPEWSYRLLVAFTILAFPLALVLAWAYDVTPDGIQRTAPAADPLHVAAAPTAASPSVMRGGAPAAAVLAVVVLVTLGAGGAAGWLGHGWSRPSQEPLPIRFNTRLGTPGLDDAFISISRDGSRVVQAVSDSTGVTRLLVRDLTANTVTAVAGTEGGYGAEFSPDGNWLVYTDLRRLLKVSLGGGPPVVLVDEMTMDGGGAWTPDGDIVFSGRNSGLWRVPSAGGAPVQLTQIDTARGEFAHWLPRVLPGGRAVLFSSYATPVARARVEAYEFRTGRTTVLVEGALMGRYSPTGHLLFVRDGAVFAIGFDPRSLKTHGPAIPVQDGLLWSPTDGRAAYDISATGTFVFLRESEGLLDRTLAWRDRAGRDMPVIERPGPWAEPRLSPDGRRIVLTRLRPKEDLWLYETARRTLTQLTRAPGAAFNAVWMPDSRHIVYSSESPVYDLRRMPVDGSGGDTTLLASAFDKYVSSIAPDGRSMLVTEYSDAFRVLIAAIGDGAPPRRLIEAGLARLAVFSPDGRWIAYSEHDGPRPEIYVRSADGSGARRLVSTGGGVQPRWTKGGREIVYLSGGSLMSATVDPASGEIGEPKALFGINDLDIDPYGRRHSYDVSPDGERFLVLRRVALPNALPLEVVVNWRPGLELGGNR
jgi:eukaryotic-like serine/threonine-protein kinase